MRRVATPVVLSLFSTMLFCLAAGSSFSQEAAPAAPKPDAPKAEIGTKPTARKPARGRLPNNFGKIGLSEEQRTSIYAVQARYQDELDKLEQQLKALRAKQMAEVEALLNADQKAKLEELRTAAKTKPEAPAPTTAPEGSTAKPATTPATPKPAPTIKKPTP